MYSVVMMMAMTGAPEMPAFFKRNGCEGGCHGGAACYGGGCYGYDACGCHGGGRRGGLFGKRGGGCHGGCYGGGCYGGGCCGYSAGCGCSGYSAGCGCCGHMANCGCCGQMQACGCCGGGMMMGQPMMGPPPGTQPPPAMPPKGPPAPGGKPTEAMSAAPATIVVSLPAEATLKIDGVATHQASNVREFSTPVLPAGQSFFYTLTAEIVRNGQTLTSVQKVTVRAGELTNVTLPVDQFGTTVAMK